MKISHGALLVLGALVAGGASGADQPPASIPLQAAILGSQIDRAAPKAVGELGSYLTTDGLASLAAAESLNDGSVPPVDKGSVKQVRLAPMMLPAPCAEPHVSVLPAPHPTKSSLATILVACGDTGFVVNLALPPSN